MGFFPFPFLPFATWYETANISLYSGSVGHTGSICSIFLNVTLMFAATGFLLSLVCLVSCSEWLWQYEGIFQI